MAEHGRGWPVTTTGSGGSQALLDGGDVSNKWRRWWGAKKNGTDPKVLDAKDKKVIVIGGRALRIIFMATTPMSWDITPFWVGYNMI